MKSMKKKSLLVSALTIVLCLSLIAGSTFALFTSESKVNVAVTSGTVNVVATPGDFQTYSVEWDSTVNDYVEVAQKDLQFSNGGQAVVNGNEIAMNLVTPGDRLEFKLTVTNYSDVTIAQRTVVDIIEDNGLFEGLEVKIDDEAFRGFAMTDWAESTPTEDTVELTVSVGLPVDAGNEYQGKTATLTYLVQAVQANGVDSFGKDLVIDETAKTAEVYSEYGLKQFGALVNSGAYDGFAGWTVSLAADIDLQGKPLVAIGTSEASFEGTFTGAKAATVSTLSTDAATDAAVAGNYTISNFTVTNTEGTGLFGYAGIDSVIQNVTVKNVVLTSHNYAGGIVGYTYGDVLNCVVEGLTANVTPIEVAGGYDDGAKAGGIVGFAACAKIDGNYVKDIDLTAYREMGGIVGAFVYDGNGTSLHWLTNNTVEGLTLAYDASGKTYDTPQTGAGVFYGSLRGAHPELIVISGNVCVDEVELPTAGKLEDQLADATGDVEVTIPAGSVFTWSTGASHGSTPLGNDATNDIVLVGAGAGATLKVLGYGVGPLRADPDTEGTLILKDLTVVDASVSYAENSWEFGYLEFGDENTDKLYFENVVFENAIMVTGEATFVNCTFDSHADSEYAVWVNGGTATFEGCTFKGTRGLKTHEAYGSEVVSITVTDSTFGPLSKKPGLAIGTVNADTTIILRDNLVSGTQAGDQGLYLYETDTDVTTFNFVNENNTIAKSVVVENAEQLETVLTEAGAAKSGNTMIVFPENATIDLTGSDWTPVKVDGYHGADVVTIDGNGSTITGLTAPLFAGGFAGGSGIVIKNLTIADSNIVSTNTIGSGAFIETVDSMDVITLDNCHLLNSTVTGGDGSRTGGLLGWTAGYNNVNDGPVKTYVTITNCSVIGNTITCNGSVGAIYGHAGNNAWTFSTVENCVVKNNKLISTDDGGWRVGVVVGTANVGELTITNITASGNTLTQTGKTAPEGQSDLYGRFVPGETGKLVIDGEEIL